MSVIVCSSVTDQVILIRASGAITGLVITQDQVIITQDRVTITLEQVTTLGRVMSLGGVIQMMIMVQGIHQAQACTHQGQMLVLHQMRMGLECGTLLSIVWWLANKWLVSF